MATEIGVDNAYARNFELVMVLLEVNVVTGEENEEISF